MIYFFVIIFLLVLAFRNDFLWQRTGVSLWHYLSLCILICLSGFRYKVGGDTIGYMDFFEDIPFLWQLEKFSFSTYQFEPFWVIFSSICKTLVNDYFFFQFVHAVIVNVIIFRFFRRTTPYYSTCIFIYFLFFYVFFNMEIMRESLAICILLLASPYFFNHKWLKFYSLAVVAFLFHSSAIIVFFFPFFYGISVRPWTLIILFPIFIGIQLVILNSPSLLNVLLFTDRLSTKFESYSQQTASINGIIFYSFIYVILPYVLMIYYKRISPNGYLFERMHSLYFVLAMLFVAISGFGRVLNYMTPFMIAYFASFLNDFYRSTLLNSKIRPQLTVIIFLIAFAPKLSYYLSSTSHLVRNTRKYNMYIPYTDIFTRKPYPYREILWRENFRYRREQRE